MSSIQLANTKSTIPNNFKKEIHASGSSYRSGLVTVTNSSGFTTSTDSKFIINGNLSDTGNVGLLAGNVTFQFPSAYAINELQFVLFDTQNIPDSELLTGKIEAFGSTDSSTWIPLNTPSGYYLDVYKINMFSTGDVLVSLPLTINVNDYNYYKITFTGFTSSTSPKIKEINFDYIGIHELTNKSTIAVPSTASLIYVFPSDLSSVVSLTNLPTPYLFVKNKECGVRCQFVGGHDFHSNVYSTLIHTIEYSTDNTNYSPLILPDLNIQIQVINKIIDFQYTATHSGSTSFRIVLKDDTQLVYKTFSFTTNIYDFPALTNTTVNDPFVPVGNTLTFNSSFDNNIPSDVTANVQITPNGQSTESITGVSVSGSDILYSMLIEHDVQPVSYTHLRAHET